MRTADECLVKAAELSQLADLIRDPEVRATSLVVAETWLDVSMMAECQDALEAKLHRIRLQYPPDRMR
jgi:hypothetical protein